jgi:7-keto-8-aminopelargonate synthetase-like enzyme
MSNYPGWQDSADLAAKLKESIKLARMNKRANKYNAKRVQVDGIWFDSKKEAARWAQLRLMQAAGLIANLIHHPEYPIEVNDIRICVVELDFTYDDFRKNCAVHEDVKSAPTKTPLSRLKHRLVEAVYGLKVTYV